jgi:hypothetical protein
MVHRATRHARAAPRSEPLRISGDVQPRMRSRREGSTPFDALIGAARPRGFLRPETPQAMTLAGSMRRRLKHSPTPQCAPGWAASGWRFSRASDKNRHRAAVLSHVALEAVSWLKQVITGFFNYHAVPTNWDALGAFRLHPQAHPQNCPRTPTSPASRIDCHSCPRPSDATASLGPPTRSSSFPYIVQRFYEIDHIAANIHLVAVLVSSARYCDRIS